jgi:RNA polymerase sigma-70 factor (ECF subfamily)
MRRKSPTNTEFVVLLTKAQPRILAFIGRMLVDRGDADDVLQDTNVALCELAENYEHGSDFMAWACRIAYFRVLQHRMKAKRLRVRFSELLVERLAEKTLALGPLESMVEAESFDRRRVALAACLSDLPQKKRELLVQHYVSGVPLDRIGETLNRSANAVAQLFYRVRGALRRCVESRLATTS